VLAPEFQDVKNREWLEFQDLTTNPAEWLEVYQLAIEAAEGDSYIMANHVPVWLSSSVRTWLLGLPMGLVHSWNHLCWLFTNNFHAMCTHRGVDWDLASIIQKKGESQIYCYIFQEGTQGLVLDPQAHMKNPRTSEEMFPIANKYALAKEATLDTREQKKEESGHTD
jgi:hypothetical protein